MINKTKKMLNERLIFLQRIMNDEDFIVSVDSVFKELLYCLQRKGKIMICGNGGSAADSQHIAAELIVKIKNLRKSLPAIALTSDTSIITSIINDISSEYIFERQLEGLANQGDVLIGLSTSGNSKNVIRALQYAKENKIVTIAITGNPDSDILNYSDHSIIFFSDNTQIVQELYMTIFHIICEEIEDSYL